ncbi:MAG: hypothetical protein H6702_25365 [Myxococcales bacterium]|nr:hypothetical protein [Myxococcales bacterium]
MKPLALALALSALVLTPALAEPGAPAAGGDTVTADLAGTAFTAEKVRVKPRDGRALIKGEGGSITTELVEVKVTVPPEGADDGANLVVGKVKRVDGKISAVGFMPRAAKCVVVKDAAALGAVPCAVHLTQRAPRLTGSFQAVLEEAGGMGKLAVKGSFDVAAP